MLQTHFIFSKINKAIRLVLIGFAISIMNEVATAEILPKSINNDGRIKLVNYSENNVIKIIGNYGMLTTIQLAKDEKVRTISMGDTSGWYVKDVGNLIFLKPIEYDAGTNMALITNNDRKYFFELNAEAVTDKNKKEVAYVIKFVYPDDDELSSIHTTAISRSNEDILPDLDRPEQYNLNYSISGNLEIAPVKIMDDGKLTFLQFSYQVKDIPAIFAVDDNLREHIVNYIPSSSKNNLIIVEQVFNKLTLRLGTKILCIYNEGYANNRR